MPVTYPLLLPLTYLGGMFYTASKRPDLASLVSPWLPTQMWSDLFATLIFHAGPAVRPLAGLFSCATAFAVVVGYRRDEGRQHR